MVFSSLIFIFRFLPLVLLLYYGAYFVIHSRKISNIILLISSIIFYAWGEQKNVILLIFSILMNYVSGLIIGRINGADKDCVNKDDVDKDSTNIDVSYRNESYKTGTYNNDIHKNGRYKKIIFILNIMVNIGVLAFYKYAGMAALPIGISFFTFQAMSYVIDVYRGNVEPEKSIIRFGLYVSLFPQLVAGPIVRYVDIYRELENRTENTIDFAGGIRIFIIGLAKKVLCANVIGELFVYIAAGSVDNLTFVNAWLGIIAFSLQIYFDFSGYSDMAIGLGRMFGFHFDRNFNYPYESKSISEFFRRWHISLGIWFKEYLYIPMGGNRRGTVVLLRNIFIVWTLTGIWHGSTLNFLIWGIYYGIIICVEKCYLGRILDRLPVIIRRIYTLFIVVLGWGIFAYDDMTYGRQYFKAMFMLGKVGLYNRETIYMIMSYLVWFIILILSCTSLPKRAMNYVYEKIGENGRKSVVMAIVEPVAFMFLLVLCIAFIVNDSYNPFLYFRF